MTKTILALLMTATAAFAQPAPRFVDHNGSLMEVISEPTPQTLRIEYVRPRAGMAAIGVVPGTVLLRGRWTGPNDFVGAATVFDPQCGAILYEVRGGDIGGELVLRGPAPLVAPYPACVVGYGNTNNSVLIFTPMKGYSR